MMMAMMLMIMMMQEDCRWLSETALPVRGAFMMRSYLFAINVNIMRMMMVLMVVMMMIRLMVMVLTLKTHLTFYLPTVYLCIKILTKYSKRQTCIVL